jgi:hypothetical protein
VFLVIGYRRVGVVVAEVVEAVVEFAVGGGEG